MGASSPSKPSAGPLSLPSGVWMLGIVSLFMDMSSEIIHALLPVFMVGTLGLSMVMVGLIEGASEAVAAVMKLFSGALSDYLGKRKVIALAGYALAAFTKPLFPLASGAGLVFTARFIDRIGKGIRGAPRDALIADITPVKIRGAAYGLRQSLDTVGALIGAFAASLLMVIFVGDMRSVMWVAVIPAALAVVVLAVGVREPARHKELAVKEITLNRAHLKRFSRRFWVFILLAGLLTLSRMSEAFLLLRGDELGLSAASVPLLLAVLSLVFALTSYPAGRLSDRLGRKAMVVAGFAFLAFSSGVLALAVTPLHVFVGAALWGAQLGLTQGVFAAMVADVAPEDLRGTAFGVFHVVTGIALLVASVGAGLLWDIFGSTVAFSMAATLATFGVLAFTFLQKEKHVKPATGT